MLPKELFLSDPKSSKVSDIQFSKTVAPTPDINGSINDSSFMQSLNILSDK